MLRKEIRAANVIVIKVGTSLLVSPEQGIAKSVIERLACVLSELTAEGKQVVLVSSGAVGIGLTQLGAVSRSAAAAVGQGKLTSLYEKAFSKEEQPIGQLLLSREVLAYPESRANFAETIHELLANKILPIINENDAVTIDEGNHLAKFADNDELALLVSKAIQADLLVMLSDVNGLYSENPFMNEEATMFQHLASIDQTLIENASPALDGLSRGGIRSKLKTASGALASNISMILANGKRPEVLFDILAGQEVGTLFKR